MFSVQCQGKVDWGVDAFSRSSLHLCSPEFMLCVVNVFVRAVHGMFLMGASPTWMDS